MPRRGAGHACGSAALIGTDRTSCELNHSARDPRWIAGFLLGRSDGDNFARGSGGNCAKQRKKVVFVEGIFRITLVECGLWVRGTVGYSGLVSPIRHPDAAAGWGDLPLDNCSSVGTVPGDAGVFVDELILLVVRGSRDSRRRVFTTCFLRC